MAILLRPKYNDAINPLVGVENIAIVERAKLWRTALIATMLCLWEAFPISIIGLPPSLSNQIYAVIVVAGLLLYIISRFTRNKSFDIWDLGPFLLFLWCCFVSVNYSVFTVPQPMIQWLPAVYTITPLFTFMLLGGLGASLSDAQRAIFWTGLLASVLVIAESIAHTGLLSYYARNSGIAGEKIVLLKLVSAFALMIAVVQAMQSKGLLWMLFNAVAAAVLAYNSVIISESRLVAVAVIPAIVLTWMFILRGRRKIIVGMFAPILILPLGWFVTSRLFQNFTNLNEYLANDTSSKWRRITDQHYAAAFQNTMGMGFGFMSGNADYDNIIAFSTTKASQLYGIANYSVGLDDIGLVSALYQYGYVGLILISIMTISTIFSLVLAYRTDSRYAWVSAVGILMALLMISPVSMNYFTLPWTAHIGGLFWFMAREVRTARRSVSLADFAMTSSVRPT